MNITLMDNYNPITFPRKKNDISQTSAITQQRKFDRFDVESEEITPLTEEQMSRLIELVEKIESCGSLSCLTETESKEYDELGRRHNEYLKKQETHNLGTAVRPWITQ